MTDEKPIDRPEAAPSGDDLLDMPFDELSADQRKALLRRFRHHACAERFEWDWSAIRYNRVALVNLLLAGRPWPPAYLEIGCDRNVLFDAVPTPDKTGVDPLRGGTLRQTSDAFFAANTRQFDVIFIDGLHEYRQVRRDVINAMAALKPDGWIAVHDMLPVTWREEHVPRINKGWTGDVWKLGMELAATPGLPFRIVLIDHGVGLLRPGWPRPAVVDLSEELAGERFAYLQTYVERLPLVTWAETIAWVDPR